MKFQLLKIYFAFFIVVPAILVAQDRIKYFHTYNDFIKGLDVNPAKVIGTSFYRGKYVSNRVSVLDHIDADGNLTTKTMFYYNQSGNLIVMDICNPDSTLISRTSYLPDDIQAQMVEKIQGIDWFPTQKDYFTVTHFDSLRKPVLYNVKASSGEDIGRLELRYNDKGDLNMEIWIRSRDNQVIELTEFTFDYINSIQHIVQYDSTGDEVSKISVRIPVTEADSTFGQ